MTEAQQPQVTPPQLPAGGLPIFYKNPQPIEPARHAQAGLGASSNFSFSRDTNAVALTTQEFAFAARTYPIVFSAQAPVVPFAVLGVRDNENLFVDKEGRWREDTYVPAYVRRYPFIFSEVPDSDRLLLCVDESASNFETVSAQPFFVDGKPSENTKRALQFSEAFHAQLQETRKFGEWLEQNGMLEEKMARAELAGGQSYTMQGFRLINPEKLNILTDAQVLDLHKKGWLPLLHFHFQSLQNWQTLTRLIQLATAA
ncbi:MAG: SapC family protein, partial [Gammaproteobacteria bacterium]